MDSEAPVGGKRRGFRFWRRALPFLIGSPVILFVAGNLCLSSPWSCRWIATKIERLTGLEARVGGATWSPWNGASIDAVELLAPAPLRAALKEPLVRIHAVRPTPVWRAWLRGRFEVRSVELDTPRFVLPVELLSHLARSVPPAPPVPPPTVAAATPPPAVVQPGPPVATPPVAVPGTPKPPPRPAPPSRPTAWLHLKNASFAIVRAGPRRNLLEISKTSGAIPIDGDSARSDLKIGLVSALGNEVAAKLTARLDWTPPLLSMEPLEAEIGGFKWMLTSIVSAAGGLPLQIEARLPRQTLAALALPFDGQASAEAVAANGRFRGLLLAPGTWQGDFVAESIKPTLRLATRETKFDRGSAVTVLRRGVISCVDARLVGDEFSVLGNAVLLPDGRAAGAVRLVAAPETVEVVASRIFPAIPGAPSLTPLGTPQRAAFDIEAFGNLSQLYLRLGKDGPIVKLKP